MTRNNVLDLTYEEVLNRVGREFLEILNKRLISLRQLGYSAQKISNLIGNGSVIQEFLKISKKYSNNLELIKSLEEIKKTFPKENKIECVLKEKFDKEKIIELEKTLDQYIYFIFNRFLGLAKEKKKFGEIEKIDYFKLKIFFYSKIIKIFPYSEIIIIKGPKGASIFIKEDHPSSNLIQIKDISGVINKVKNTLVEVEKKVISLNHEEIICELSKALFNSLFPLTKELGISGKDSEKIISSKFNIYL